VKPSPQSEDVRPLGLLTRLAIIAGVLVIVGGLAIWLAFQYQLCEFGLSVAALVVCVISSLVAHVAGEYPSGQNNYAARLALSTAVRTGLPFLAVIVVKIVPSLQFESGFVLLVILFYCVGLAVDVPLQTARIKASQ